MKKLEQIEFEYKAAMKERRALGQFELTDKAKLDKFNELSERIDTLLDEYSKASIEAMEKPKEDKGMTSKDIEAIFTGKVAEFIAKGYTINVTTMAGSQGEVAKVDLTNGEEIIRVLLQDGMEFSDMGACQRTTLTVGRATDPVRKSHPFDTMCSTIWNEHLEVIEQRNFYRVDSGSNNFSENRDTIKEQHDKQMKRYRVRDALSDIRTKKDLTTDSFKQALLPWVRKQPRCGKTKLDDIVSVVRWNADAHNKMRYIIKLANGKSFKLA